MSFEVAVVAHPPLRFIGKAQYVVVVEFLRAFCVRRNVTAIALL